jgi:hypothetical protein
MQAVANTPDVVAEQHGAEFLKPHRRIVETPG